MLTESRIVARLVGAAIAIVLALSGLARGQELDAAFNPGANSTVRAIAVQADGKIVVGGAFTGLGGGTGTTLRNFIGRLNADGSVDSNFNPGANGIVYALAVQPDGKILVGGQFTMMGGGGTGNTGRNSLARLNADGSLDTNFNPGADGLIYALAVQSDGKIVVSGQFTMLGGGGTGTTARSCLGRLNADGSLDTSFNPGADGLPYALALQPGGKILVGGSFSMLGGGGAGTTTRNFLGRLNTDGSLDSGFNPGANGIVYALAAEADGRILVGGAFMGLGGGTGATPRARFGRLNTDGSVDSSLDPGANNTVFALTLQGDGKIVVGGLFTSFGGGGTGLASHDRLVRLNVAGDVDSSFGAGATGTVFKLTQQADGRLLVGGTLTALRGAGASPTARSNIGRFVTGGGAPAAPPIPAEIMSPAPGSTLAATTVAVEWTGGANVTQYVLHVGSTPAGTDLLNQDQGTSLRATVTGLPADGRALYVRLWSVIGGVAQFRDYAYMAATGASARGELISPAPGSTLTATTVAFEWTGGRAVTRYWLHIGSSAGGTDLFSQDQGTNLRTTVPGLPADGRTLYVRLWSVIGGVWQFRDYTYTAATGGSVRGELVRLGPGATLAATRVAFEWTGGRAVTRYWLYVGSTPGDTDLFSQDQGTNLRATVAGLPADGRALHVRLWSVIGGVWQFRDYTYTAAGGPSALAELARPAPGSTLAATTVAFEWTGGRAVTRYWLHVGSTLGGVDLLSQDQGTNLRTTATGLPADGRTLYIRLWSVIGGAWNFTDYTYTATTNASARGELMSPAPMSTLTASTVTFEWTGGTNVTRYWLHVGSTAGGTDLVSQDQGTNLRTTVTGLPTDGRVLYFRLWSVIGGVWQFRDYTYTAASGSSARAELTSPASSSTLAATTVAFEWTGGRAVTRYWLYIGSAPGASDLLSQDQGTSLRATVTGLPADGRTLYVRLWSVIGGVWSFTDYAYTASSSP